MLGSALRREDAEKAALVCGPGLAGGIFVLYFLNATRSTAQPRKYEKRLTAHPCMNLLCHGPPLCR